MTTTTNSSNTALFVDEPIEGKPNHFFYPPPELLNDSEEDDEDSLCTPSLSLSPKQVFKDQDLMIGRKKSIPHKSPSTTDQQSSQLFPSIIFQLNCTDNTCTSKIIAGQSILSCLRKKLIHVRQHPYPRHSKRVRAPSIIEIPRSNHSMPIRPTSSDQPMVEENKKKTRRQSNSSGRPTRVKGPCQACNEPSDGCMRKAFNWPFPTSQTFNDKGKPFVYLCNKCGLRYNKSDGCVCRHCRWVFCKEEKRKAMQYIDAMRSKRPDGHIDPDEDIENFVCRPKYWHCGKPWKVGWVLNQDDLMISSPSSL